MSWRPYDRRQAAALGIGTDAPLHPSRCGSSPHAWPYWFDAAANAYVTDDFGALVRADYGRVVSRLLSASRDDL